MGKTLLVIGCVLLALALVISGCGQKGPGAKLDENDVAVSGPGKDANTLSQSDVPDASSQAAATTGGPAASPGAAAQPISDSDISPEAGSDSSLLSQEDVAPQS